MLKELMEIKYRHIPLHNYILPDNITYIIIEFYKISTCITLICLLLLMYKVYIQYVIILTD